MTIEQFVHRVLRDDGLTRGLEDAEARELVEWLVDQADVVQAHRTDPAHRRADLAALLRRGKAVRSFVVLWCYECQYGAAIQLAATERLSFPLPDPNEIEPLDLMLKILRWERAGQASAYADPSDAAKAA